MRSQSSGECVVVGMGLSRWLGWGGGDIRGGVEIYECSSWSDNCFIRVSSDKCCIYISAHISTVYMCYAQET